MAAPISMPKNTVGVHDIKTGDAAPGRPPPGPRWPRDINAPSREITVSPAAPMAEALGHGFYRVAGAVQFIRHADGLFAQAAHLRQSARVVHDGAVGVVAR